MMGRAVAFVLAVAVVLAGAWLVFQSLEVEGGARDGEAEAIVLTVEATRKTDRFMEQMALSGDRQAGYVFWVDGQTHRGAGPVEEGVGQAGRIDVRYDPADPSRSHPVHEGDDRRYLRTPIFGLVLLLAGLVVAIGSTRGEPGRSFRQANVVVVLAVLLLVLDDRMDRMRRARMEALVGKTVAGDWGEHGFEEGRGHHRIVVLSTADDTTAFAQSRSNEVNYPGLAFGNHSSGSVDLAMIRFLLLVPPGSRITGAHLAVACNSNRNDAGSAAAVYSIERIPGDRQFDIENFEDYDALAAIPVVGQPIEWSCPPWTKGEVYRSPDIAPLVQALVDDPAYRTGDYLALRLGPATRRNRWSLQYLRYAGAAGARPIELEIDYALAERGP